MNKILAVAILLMGPASGGSGLAGQEQRTVTLEEALRLFAENNVELHLAREGVRRAAGLADQAGAFPNPTASVTHEPLSADGVSYSETYLNLGQRFEAPGIRGARRAAASERLESARYEFRADSSRVAFEVKRAYVEAAQAAERIAVLDRVLGVFRDAVEAAQERYAAGDASLYDLRRFEVERLRFEDLYAEAELAVAETRARLTSLILPVDQGGSVVPVGLPEGTPAFTLSGDLEETALTRRPESVAAGAELAAARQDLRFAGAERLPDPAITAGYKRQSDGFSGLFLGLSLSLPTFDRNRGAIAGREAEVASAGDRLALVRREVRRDVRLAEATYQSLERRWELVGEGSRTGGEADLLEIATAAYEEGEMDLVELLDAADALRTVVETQIRLHGDLWISYYDLERALGGFENPSPGTEESGR